MSMTKVRKERLEQLKMLHTQNMTVEQMKKVLNISKELIKRDLKFLDLKIHTKKTLLKQSFNGQINELLLNGWIKNNNIMVHPNEEFMYRINETTCTIKKVIPYLMEKNPDKKISLYQYKRVSYKSNSNYLHRIKWEIINGEIPKGMTIHHIDGNILNNRLDNLKLTNQSYISNKTIKRTLKEQGKKWIGRKPKSIKCHQNDKIYPSITQACKELKLKNSVIVSISRMINDKPSHTKIDKNGNVKKYYHKSIHGYTFEKINI